jgi:hypothetical protein
MLAPVVGFHSLHLLISVMPANGFVPPQFNVKAGVLDSERNKILYMDHPEGYVDGNRVTHLKKGIYGLKQSPRDWYSRHMAY